jgi:hypothetical protein
MVTLIRMERSAAFSFLHFSHAKQWLQIAKPAAWASGLL